MPDTPADSRQDRKRCKSPRATGEYAMTGSDYCRWHGGVSIRAQRVASQAIAQSLTYQRRSGEARVSASDEYMAAKTPLEALNALTAQVTAWEKAIAAKVTELLRDREAGNGVDDERLRAAVTLWERALDRCTRTLTAMARLQTGEPLAGLEAAGEDVRHLFENPGDDGQSGGETHDCNDSAPL